MSKRKPRSIAEARNKILIGASATTVVLKVANYLELYEANT